MKFEIIKDKFYRDGEEIKIISGAVHYFRNMRETWRDILKKLCALGCNCVETYCVWNMHEKKPNEFCFEDNLDIAHFIKIAQEEGLMVIIRPGPYICAEWEFGGLPWWIQTYENMEIRCNNEIYFKCFENYLSHLFDEIRPLLCTNGGPIIMMQCENEYGCYGDDKAYLEALRDCYRRLGIDVILFTSDGTQLLNLLDGSIDGCLPTLNFGSNVSERFALHNKMFPDVPKMCMEMWDGWFDHWGNELHHTTSAEDYAKTVDDMLAIGSLNMYMFIGGTNFGFMNGANHTEKYLPHVTSYDYDALLSECGDITPKYHAIRAVIQKHTRQELPAIPENRRKKAYGKAFLMSCAGILDNLSNLSNAVFSKIPKDMETYGIGYGYVAYCTQLNNDYENAILSFESLGDRAQIYVGKKLIGIVYVNDDELAINFSAKKGDVLTILCENMGRANYGAKMMRKKGIVGRCLIDNRVHFNWDVYLLPMDNLEKLQYQKEHASEPSCFYKGEIVINDCADTFLYLKNFTKGFVVINGFNLGRYWDIGPQKSLYVPKSVLRKGKNQIIVFESDGIKGDPILEFLDYPSL